MFHDVNSIFVKILLNRSPCFSGISRAGLSQTEKSLPPGDYALKSGRLSICVNLCSLIKPA